MPVNVYDQAGNLTTLSRVLRDNYLRPFLKSLDNDTFMLRFFPRKSHDEAFIRWKVKYEGNDGVEWYDEHDPFGQAGRQSYENAVLPIKMVRILAEWSGLAEAATKGQGSYVNVKTDELEGAMDDLRDAINDRIIAFRPDLDPVTEGKMICRMAEIIDDQGVYAGIDRANTPWWRSVVLNNNPAGEPRPLGVGLMQQMHAALQVPRRKAKISAILTSQTHLDQYGDLADARRRFIASDGKAADIDLGVDTLKYKGITMYAVPNMDDGKMFFIDKRSWGTFMLVPFDTEELPKVRDASTFAIKSYLQLVCQAPYQQGVINDLDA